MYDLLMAILWIFLGWSARFVFELCNFRDEYMHYVNSKRLIKVQIGPQITTEEVIDMMLKQIEDNAIPEERRQIYARLIMKLNNITAKLETGTDESIV